MQHETLTCDEGVEAVTPKGKQTLNQLLARQTTTQASKTPVMKKSSSKHHMTLLESCCFMPQHTRSSEQVKLGANLAGTSSRKDLLLQKFRESNNENYPKLEIND